MKIISNNILKCGLFGGVLLMSVSACTDDHYDIRIAEESAKNTIWQNVMADPQLDSLAMILQRVKVYRREPVGSSESQLTYAQLLDQPQSFTLWAPKNGTYNAKTWLDQLDKIDQMTDKVEAATEEYKIGLQFAQNHIARYNYESNMSEQEVRMMNSKICYYDRSNNLFNGVKLDESESAHVSSSNGMVHVLDGLSPFAYNVYDYMKEHTTVFSKVYNALSDPEFETTEFDEDESIPGALNEEGEMVYVDSVFTTTNEILNSSSADISNEDSLYLAVIPTNEAWDAAYAKVAALYNYADEYSVGYSTSSGSYNTEKYTLNADSLQSRNATMALLSSMYFTPGNFGTTFSRTDSAGIVNYALYADSLFSTNYTCFYNPTPGQRNILFGDESLVPIKASNGYIFAISDYQYDPSYSFQSEIEYSLAYSTYVGYSNNQIAEASGEVIELTSDYWDAYSEDNLSGVKGTVEDNTYRYFYTDASRDAYFTILLPNVYSGKYRVLAEILPNRVYTSNKWFDEDGTEIMQESKFYAQIFLDGETRALAKSDDITVDDYQVQRYVLFDEIEFTRCYASLPSTVSGCYPTLRFTLPRGKSYRPVDDVPYGLSISKIILEPVRE